MNFACRSSDITTKRIYLSSAKYSICGIFTYFPAFTLSRHLFLFLTVSTHIVSPALSEEQSSPNMPQTPLSCLLMGGCGTVTVAVSPSPRSGAGEKKSHITWLTDPTHRLYTPTPTHLLSSCFPAVCVSLCHSLAPLYPLPSTFLPSIFFFSPLSPLSPPTRRRAVTWKRKDDTGAGTVQHLFVKPMQIVVFCLALIC